MVWCKNCAKHVPGVRPYNGGLACDLCGKILENFNFSTEFTFFKNAAGRQVLEERIEGISLMSKEDLGAVKEERQQLVLPGENASLSLSSKKA